MQSYQSIKLYRMKKYINRSIFLWFILSFLMLFVQDLQAQITIVSGKITSKTNGEALVGATVAESDANGRFISVAITDVNGNYALRMKNPGNTVSISYIGFIGTKVIPGTRTTLNVSLDELVSQIGEVVVSANRTVNTGELNIEPARIATAMTTISVQEISDFQANSVVDQLQGRISGVDIVAESGEPGAGMSIRIRGTSSLNSNSQPLIVINGVPFETKVDGSFDFASADEQAYAALIGVAAEDIEDISVLKDAAATAQYGSRAANGVLLINTKRGKRGPAMFNYSFKGTLGIQPEGFPMLNGYQYATLIKEELLNVNNRTNYEQINFNPDYEFYNLYNKNINWADQIIQPGWINEHNFSVSGGGEKASYRVSTTYKGETGTVKGSASGLITVRAILDYYISEKLRISSELSYSRGDVDRSYGGILDLAKRKMPNMSIYELDADGNSTGAYYTPVNAFQGAGTTYYNPVAMSEFAVNNVVNNRISPVFRLTYKPTKTLGYDAIVSFDMSNDQSVAFVPEAALGAAWTNASANKATLGNSEFYVVHTENRLVWNPKLPDKHSLFVGTKFETDSKVSQGYTVVTSNSPSGMLKTPIVVSRLEGEGNSLSSSFSESRTLGLNFTFNYQFQDRYILSGGVRTEGNSKFGDEYRYGTFPSIAAKWIASREPFMQQFEFIDELSFRFSYGVNGNAPGFNYGKYNTYSTYNYNYIDVRPVYPSTIELVNLKWETVVQRNFGMNLTMFKERVNVDLEFYTKSTKDMLNANTSIPSSSGFATLTYLNLGDIDNKGIELSVFTTLYRTEKVKIDLNFNISRNINLIKRITEAMDVEDGNPLTAGSGGYLKRIQEDNPIGSFYGYEYDGVYSTKEDLYALDENGEIISDIDGNPKYMRFNNSRSFQVGEARYIDQNHDGNINRMDVIYLGNANPLLFGGWGPNITYKQWQLNIFFNFRYKQKIVNLARMSTESMTNYDNQSTAVLRRWRTEGDITDIPKAYYNSPVNNLASDRFLEDASFMRMKYLTLRYNVPRDVISKIKAKNAYVYFTGQNLLTFTRYLGTDPETGQSDNWKSLGYDSNKTPRSRQYTIGVNLSF